MLIRISCLLFLFCLSALFGCQQRDADVSSDLKAQASESEPAEGGQTNPAENTASENADSDEDAIQLREGNWDDVMQVVQASEGKIVVVDIWSLSCLPCLKEFPGLVALHNDFADDVVCVSLSVDYAGRASRPPSYYEPKVRAFLTKQQAHFPNFQCNVESLELFDALEIDSIPVVFVFDRSGELLQTFDASMLEPGEEEPFSYEHDIRPFVEKLVGQ